MRKSGKGVQTTINVSYNKELREEACVHIARWIYEAAIPFNVVNYDSFKVAIQSIRQYGIGMKLLSYHEERVPLLKKEVAHTDDIMKSHKEEWARTRCSIMSNGWQDKSHRSLVNFWWIALRQASLLSLLVRFHIWRLEKGCFNYFIAWWRKLE